MEGAPGRAGRPVPMTIGIILHTALGAGRYPLLSLAQGLLQLMVTSTPGFGQRCMRAPVGDLIVKKRDYLALHVLVEII